MWIRCAAWGGASLGVGTLAYALCSPSNAACSTNLIVLTHGTVTARGCAVFSVVARSGLGLMVLGAVLLLGSFIVNVRARRQSAVVDPQSETSSGLPDAMDAMEATEPATEPVAKPAETPADVVTVPSSVGDDVPPGRRTSERVGPIPPGVYSAAWEDAIPAGPMTLPPGWYGNPNNPDRPVQWWDGTRLTDRPSRPAR